MVGKQKLTFLSGCLTLEIPCNALDRILKMTVRRAPYWVDSSSVPLKEPRQSETSWGVRCATYPYSSTPRKRNSGEFDSVSALLPGASPSPRTTDQNRGALSLPPSPFFSPTGKEIGKSSRDLYIYISSSRSSLDDSGGIA